jgi:hypothetical protein
LGGERRDTSLLGSQAEATIDRALQNGFPGGAQFCGSAIGEPAHAEFEEELMGAAQLVASVSLPSPTPKPLSEKQSGPRYLELHTCRYESLDGLEVEGFSFPGVSEQRSTPRMSCESPVCSARLGPFH